MCLRCHKLVDASDWKGLRDWGRASSQTYGTRLLWTGFRQNRTGPAVYFTSVTDPEQGR